MNMQRVSTLVFVLGLCAACTPPLTAMPRTTASIATIA